MGEFIVELFFGAIEYAGASWRFWAALGAAILVGVLVLPHLPEGTPRLVAFVILALLGIGGGLWWRSLAKDAHK